MKYWKLKTTVVNRNVISHLATGGELELSSVQATKTRVVGGPFEKQAFTKVTSKAAKTLFSVHIDGSRTRLATAAVNQSTALAIHDHVRLMDIMDQRRSEGNLITQCTEATATTRCVAEWRVPPHLIAQYLNSRQAT